MRGGAQAERRAPTTTHTGGEQPAEGQRGRTAEARLCGTHGRRVAKWQGAAHTTADFFFVKEEWRRGAEVERRAPTTMHIGGGQPGEGQRERTAEARLCGTHGRRVAMSVAWLSAHHGDFF